MNKPIAAAAVLATVTVGVHVFLGGPEINAPVRQSDLPELVRVTSWVVWHGISVILIVIAAGLAWLAAHRNPALAMTLSAIQIGFALLFLGFGLSQLGEVWSMPQWAIFLLIPALTFWGMRKWV